MTEIKPCPLLVNHGGKKEEFEKYEDPDSDMQRRRDEWQQKNTS